MNDNINLDTKFQPVKDVQVTEVQDSGFALNLIDENYYGLNSTAFEVYSLLSNGSTLAEAVKQMNEIYEVEEEQLKMDLHTVTKDLLKSGIIKIA